MRLLLINPHNPLTSMVNAEENRWNKYSVWKPLGLMTIAGLTPKEWDIEIIDENVTIPDYQALDKPDIVGITAFTSQVNRAYELASLYKSEGIPVIMGGIHATMCPEEALQYVDTVVTGEAESIWAKVIEDFLAGKLNNLYTSERIELGEKPPARHDLLTSGYFFGSIQISRGCPLACSFCSVTAFNGGQYRRRPIEEVIEEFRLIKEKNILIVDDNLIGTSPAHIAYTKELLQAMIDAKLNKKWVAQVTINMADDKSLLDLAKKAGCFGVFIGFESIDTNGLAEINKKIMMKKGLDVRASVQRIQRHGISVVGSFIIGLDVDKENTGTQIAQAADAYGIDVINLMMLTPLPGTKLWDKLRSENRIIADNYPLDWQYYTLTFPVLRFENLSWESILQEKDDCNRYFYSYKRILRRTITSILQFRSPLMLLIANLSYRKNTLKLDKKSCASLNLFRDTEYVNTALS